MDAALSTRVISELLDQVDGLKKGSDQKLTLCYFDGRGFGEIPRTMFAVSCTTFEDKRKSNQVVMKRSALKTNSLKQLCAQAMVLPSQKVMAQSTGVSPSPRWTRTPGRVTSMQTLPACPF
jgi:hypothetical protein